MGNCSSYIHKKDTSIKDSSGTILPYVVHHVEGKIIKNQETNDEEIVFPPFIVTLIKNLKIDLASSKLLTNLPLVISAINQIFSRKCTIMFVDLPCIEIMSDCGNIITFQIYYTEYQSPQFPWKWKFVLTDRRQEYKYWGDKIKTDSCRNFERDQGFPIGVRYEAFCPNIFDKLVDKLIENKCSTAAFLRPFKILLENDPAQISFDRLIEVY